MPSLFQPLAVLVSLALALPPGWCGGFSRAESGAPTPGCCSASAAAHRVPDAGKPDAPIPGVPEEGTLDCCCDWDATAPREADVPEQPAADGVVSLAAAAPELVGSAPMALRPSRGGPRLHVLNCVWRC